MKSKISAIAIIPARGNSKAIKKKNLKKIYGKSLVEYAIIAAKSSKFIDQIVISSENKKILSFSNQYNCLKHIRPKNLLHDETSTEEVIESILKSNIFSKADIIVLLEPTSPIRSIKTIDDAIQKLYNSKSNSIFTLCKTNKFFWIVKNDKFISIQKDQPRRRQLRNNVFFECGTVYAVRYKYFKIHKKLICNNPEHLVVKPEETIDINEKYDLEICLNEMKKIKQNKSYKYLFND